jgi:hypothetical protein
VYAVGFGKGAAGLNGTGFQLLIVLFMLLFGISLGQLIAAISPSVQVSLHFVRGLVDFIMYFIRLLCSSTPSSAGSWALFAA